MVVRSRAYAWYVLGLLTTINFVNYVDRLVVVGIYDDLRRLFALSDAQLGSLTTAFFTVHALTTIPFGWAADRWDRRRILALGIIAWSLATLASAYAVGYLSLAVLIGLIGLGEAAYGPVANSLLCEVFRPAEKARTVAIFNGAMFVGACVGIGIGGWFGFPLAYKVVAVPGLFLGVAAYFLDVPRVRQGPHLRPSEGKLASLFGGMALIMKIRTLRWMLGAGILISFAAGGYITWFTDFIIAYKGMPATKAGVVIAAIVLTGGSMGVVIGGLVADELQRHCRFGRTLTIAIGFAASVPFALGAIFIDRGWMFFASSWLLMFFLPWYTGPMGAVVDDVVDDTHANIAQASFSFMLHLLGSGPAALLVGIAATYWNKRYALLLPTAASALGVAFCLVACRYVARDMQDREHRLVLAHGAARERAAMATG